MRLAPGARACACVPGVRCQTCSESSRVRVRHIIHGGDQGSMGPGGAGRVGQSHEQIVNRRDTAWTARDLTSLYCDRERTPATWWEVEWPEQYGKILADFLPKPLHPTGSPCNVSLMNTTQTATTVTLSLVAGRVTVTANGRQLGTVKNGGRIIANAERILRAAGIVRTDGYSTDADKNMVAPAIVLTGAVA